jgi:hypothetical protein
VPAVNFLKALRDNNIIENDVFMIQHLEKGAMIKFGGWDTAATDGALTFLECNSQKDWTLVMETAFLVKDDTLASATLAQARTARLDLSRPYLYIP